MNYSDLQPTTTRAEELLFELYGMKATAITLPGEIDFNFKMVTDNGTAYLLKISRPNADENYLDFQKELIQHIATATTNNHTPQLIQDSNKQAISSYKDISGQQRKVRLHTWVSGRVWSAVNPQIDGLRHDLGQQCGILTSALQGFSHSEASRAFEWDVAQSLWTKKHLSLFSEEEKALVYYFQERFESEKASYDLLRKSIVHNDVNDNNILVSTNLLAPKVTAIIDYGDAIHTQIINDVAIACAYAMMHHTDPLAAALPLVKGYHETFTLQEHELEHLYTAIGMRLVISVTKSAINKVEEPNNTYLTISEKPAWELLKKWKHLDAHFAHYSFRGTGGFEAHPNETVFYRWAAQRNFSLKELFPSINSNEAHGIDMSVSSSWIGHQQDFNNLDLLQFKINQLQKEVPKKIIAGGYLEPRALYTASSYEKIGNNGKENRSIHLGVDYWLPANTPVHAILDGEVVMVANDTGAKGYGGFIILKHNTTNFEFYTLYGHNTPESVLKHKPGIPILKGEKIAELANTSENGNWVPHLHFQVMLSLLEFTHDFPGVAYPSEAAVWKSICPDPNQLFKSKALEKKQKPSHADLIAYRKKHLGKSLKLHYQRPIHMVRGAGQYLMDAFGQKYLDTVNNVAHVGHEHYAVVRAGQEQMALLNTNSRYLHENINALSKELIATLPPELNVLHFVNSGSEANELAIRMAHTATGAKDIIASQVGYHGNTNMCIDISSYKFDGKGGQGAPEHTHIFPLPDAFRGKYRGKDSGEDYAKEVQQCIDNIHTKGRKVGGFIIEPIISCGGQIELPNGFLASAHEKVRAAGGVCISDEVQVGCGRVGKTFWGFQLHGVTPDIVTIGKPLGNGHPIAAVACTQEIADRFANGMEYFNTFGGNPVSCAIATQVLKTVKEEKLQAHALEVGTFLKSSLEELRNEFPIIGDVRGQGFFLGIELVDAHLNPLPAQTAYLANRMKDHGILMSTDGPDHNVLKIKPPMVFTQENAQELLGYLKKILAEDAMRIITCT